MFSPKRASLSPCASCQAHAARDHQFTRSCACWSRQWPTTTLRLMRMRLTMKPNSRSPCADWFRFMRSMSIPAHGISRLNWVWRWRRGFCSALRPPIHIFAGQKVCIQAMRPTQFGSALASRHRARTASGEVTTGLNVIFIGIAGESFNEVARQRGEAFGAGRLASRGALHGGRRLGHLAGEVYRNANGVIGTALPTTAERPPPGWALQAGIVKLWKHDAAQPEA